MMKKNKTALRALLTALALIFSYIEVLIPISIGIPGIKLGLANIVVVVCLYVLSPKDALLINVVRIVLSGLLFGNAMSILYSLGGGLFSFLIMFLIKYSGFFSVYGVSIAGGAAHNAGQIAVAALMLKNIMVAYYLPALLITGALTGLLIGFLSYKLIPVVKRLSPV